MKKLILVGLCILFLLGLKEVSAIPTFSLNSTNSTTAGTDIEHRLQWQDAVGLSGYIFSFNNNSNYIISSNHTINATSQLPVIGNRKAICIDDLGYIHTAYRTATGQVKYSKSKDNGVTWNTTILGGAIILYRPSISCDSNNIFVAFNDGGVTRINMSKSTDRGGTWTSIKTVYDRTFDTDKGGSEVIVKGNNVYLVFLNKSAASPPETAHIVFMNSSDLGVTWSGYTKIIKDSTVNFDHTSFAVVGTGTDTDRLYVVADDITNNLIYFTRSLDAGKTWSTNVSITTNIGTFLTPTITAYNDKVYVACDNGSNIVFMNSSDNGTTWSTPIDIYDSSEDVGASPSLTTNRIGNPIVFFSQNDSGIYNLVYKEYNGNEWLTAINITNSTTDDVDELSVTPNYDSLTKKIHIIYENGAGNGDVFYASLLLDVYVNDSFVPMKGTLNWSNVTKRVSSTIGANISWIVHANDTSDNWNMSDTFSYILTAPTPIVDNPPYYTVNSNITNSTHNGSDIIHSLQWNDETALSGYIFSFCNGSWNGSDCAVSQWEYSGLSYNLSSEDTSPQDIFYNGSHWFMIGSDNKKIYVYNSTWNYTNISYYVGNQDAFPVSLYFNDSHWFLLGNNQNGRIYVYNSTWNYTGINYSLINPELNEAMGFYFKDPYWWVIPVNAYVFRYNLTWNYTNVNFSIDNEDSLRKDIHYLNPYWYANGILNPEIFIYNSTWNYTGNSIDLSSEISAGAGAGIFYYDNNWYALDSADDEVHVYSPTSIWTNDSWVEMKGTLNWSNVTKRVSSTVGNNVSWKIYVNDSTNQWNESATFYYTLISPPDTTAPVISNLSNYTTTNSSTYITWNTNENANYTFKLYNVSNRTIEVATANNSNYLLTRTLNITNLLSFTTYWINLTVCDSSGNCAENNTFNFTTVKTIDLSSPTYTNFQNNASTLTKINGVVNWSIDFSDNIGLSYYFFAHNQSGTLTNVSNETLIGTSEFINYTLTITLAQGNYICGQYWVNDTSNNINQTNSSCFTVANTAPNQPTISFPIDGKNYSDTELDINFTATDDDNDALTFTLYINNTINVTGTSTNVTDWNASDGYYNLTVTASDGIDSSINSTVVNFRLDTIFPTYSNFQNNASTLTKINGVVNWSIDLTDGTGLSYYFFAHNNSGTLTNVSNGTLSGTSASLNKTITITLPQGNYICGQFWFNDTFNNINQTLLTESGDCFTVADTLPTVPTSDSLTPNNPVITDELTGSCTGSNDADSDTITYHYRFYDVTESSERQAFSTDNTYQLSSPNDIADQFRLDCRATTDLGNSLTDRIGTDLETVRTTSLYEINTFSDGTSTGKMYFYSSVYKNISLPYWAVVTKAELDLKGYPGGCYQESANVSTSCGGLDNGSYYLTPGGFWTNGENVIDGDFNTYGIAGVLGYALINYTRPNSALNESIWTFRVDDTYINVTINETCWKYDNDKLLLAVVSQGSTATRFRCYNESGDTYNDNNFTTLYTYSGGTGNVYEEAMWWMYYPSNLTIRTNNEITYQNLSVFSGTVTDIDLNISSFQRFINSNCDESHGNYCNITINFTSATTGILEYSNIEVTYVIPLNITFKDEKSDAIIEGESLSIYLETTGFSQLYTSTNPFKVNLSIAGTYDLKASSTNYPSREYVIDVLEARNDLVLYLINSTDSVEKTFSIFSETLNPLENVFVVFTRLIGGTWTTIAEEYSDYAGQVKLNLDENYEYTINFSKTGYETQIITLEPTDDDYVITMISTVGIYNVSVYEGITYKFEPSNTVLNNNTKYNFTFTLNSSGWGITNCNLTLKNGSEVLSTTSSYTANSCYLRIEQDTRTMTNITSEAVYELNSEYAFPVSQQYSVIYTYEGEFSLKSFLDDLTDFSMAGFDSFGRMILAFIVIFVILAMASMKISFEHKEVPIFIFWALVGLFSYVNWFYLDIANMPNILGLKKYFIFYLVSIVGGAFIWNKLRQ